MSGFKIFKELLELAFGVAIVVFALAWNVLDAWIAILGAGLILWAAYNIAKELRDRRESSDVSVMAAERNRIMQGE
jgi:divalent metal cation (Fe/Co/Zn/Cd) transporter